MSFYRLCLILVLFVIIFVATLLVAPQKVFAQTPPAASAPNATPGPATKKYSSEYTLFVGPLLPSKIGGVTEVLHGVGARAGVYTRMGIFEPEVITARGDGVEYNIFSFDYRMDVVSSVMSAHFLLGGHVDYYKPATAAGYRIGPGWQYGGGAFIPLAGPFALRADFKYRFGPGTSLIVGVGLAMRLEGGTDTP